MVERNGCDARQYSDQMSCARCGTAWDVNDPEPPKCGRFKDHGETWLQGIRQRLEAGVRPVPAPEAPADLGELLASRLRGVVARKPHLEADLDALVKWARIGMAAKRGSGNV